MNRRSGVHLGLFLCPFALLGMLILSGCGGSSAQVVKDEGPPPTVQQSNKAMQDFMSKGKNGAKR